MAKDKCEFCGGTGEFSRDNSDGVAIEGKCGFCNGTGNADGKPEEVDPKISMRRETALSYLERIKFKVETCEDINTLNHIRIELYELLERLH